MMFRRKVNDFASEPVDFYRLGLEMAQRHTHLGATDAILDVGCSSGRFIIEAAATTEISSYLVGLDPDPQAFHEFLPPSLRGSRFAFLCGKGEAIPLSDNAVKVVTGHNVLFRADNLQSMLSEMKRVTEPDGLIVVSTNARNHAHWRHRFESLIAVAVSQELKIFSEPMYAPAHGVYLEQVPDIIERVGGLIIEDHFVQNCHSKITRGERLDTLAQSLQLSANRFPGNDPRVRPLWRRIVAKQIVPFIERHIDRHEQAIKGIGGTTAPYFADVVHRGLFVLRNLK